MVGTMQPKVLGEFYKAVFQKDPDMSDDSMSGWMVGGCFFGVGEHSEMGGKTKDPGRVMFNLETSEVKAEFDRIKDIEDVEVVKEPYEMEGVWIATLADPDGNYFQLMTPWEADKKD